MLDAPCSARSFIVIDPVLEKFSILNLAFKSAILNFDDLFWLVSILDKDLRVEGYLTSISKE